MSITLIACDIIVQRWMKLTGNKVKRNGEEIDSL